jgi:hypothetical protein
MTSGFQSSARSLAAAILILTVGSSMPARAQSVLQFLLTGKQRTGGSKLCC